VRACEEVQGTFALTIQGRGFGSRVSASQNQPFLDSECVSCGACVEACPTAALTEKSIIGLGVAERAVSTTCAYCGVGCGFKAELRGEGDDVEVVRMVPDRDGKANHGHACIKGRFAWGYATHSDRVKKPMIRQSIRDEWREVSWEEAIGYAASELRRIQAKYGRNSIGGITVSRCTNEETTRCRSSSAPRWAPITSTPARVCHSPTGYGLKSTLGESAGHAGFRLGAAGDAGRSSARIPRRHPVFGSQPEGRRVRVRTSSLSTARDGPWCARAPRWTCTCSCSPVPTWR
jgi:formate dehydrogenase major subunit